MAAIEAPLKRWLKREHETVPFPTKFKLKTLQLDTEASNIGEWESDSEAWRQDPIAYIDGLAGLVLEASSTVTKAAMFAIKFELRSIIVRKRGEKPSTRAQLPWTERGQARDRDSGSLGEMEPATSSGLLAQFMRHLEKKDTIISEMHEMTVGVLKAENFDLRKHRQLDDSEWMARRKAMEKLLDRSHERDLQVKQIQMEEDRKTQLYGTLMSTVGPAFMQHFPAIVEKFLGPPENGSSAGPPGLPAPTSAMPPGASNETVVDGSPEQIAEADKMKMDLRRIFTSLPQELQLQMFQALKPEDQMDLMGWLEAESKGKTKASEPEVVEMEEEIDEEPAKKKEKRFPPGVAVRTKATKK